ncbi:hypothetical protein Amir_0963 [Actinosynnema mirum DSM 43827]|uniref:Transposase IS4 family protein n=1 Tax=Actinosynnema mirum (strain ATCC 29888 / DSM 43827 / JCM 3225 / NBRC 14064 / NCIMB 13271 / NRRL B-12336 / IMRU 3971 / 101) TaxID=446462 RepID=C6WNK2_ACTMD|nr:hypothetical protein Amir_0963 [Actinosynnema mirum DSM 43827]
MLSYPAAIPLSNHTLIRLADLIRAERTRLRTRWRRLDPGRQALPVLAHLRNGDTRTRLAAGFDISHSTAWRHVREAVDLLVALADDLRTAGERAARLAYAILDGTLVPIDRATNRKPYHSGKHRRHGVNVQIPADPAGRLVWASATSPGAVHDLTAARTHDLIDMLTTHDVTTFADKAYQGAGGTVRALRSSATPHVRGCHAARRRSTGHMPASAPSANAPCRCSRAGKCWSSCAAVRAGPPRSSRPSSFCTTSRPAPNHDEKGSLVQFWSSHCPELASCSDARTGQVRRRADAAPRQRTVARGELVGASPPLRVGACVSRTAQVA